MNQNYAQKSADVIKSPFPAADCQRLRAGLRESSFFRNLTGISSEGEFDGGCQLKPSGTHSWSVEAKRVIHHPNSRSVLPVSLSLPSRSSDLGL